MSVHLTILGSGSGGNCAYLETAETRLLIDAGFSGRQIRQRLATIARAPETLHGILITHEHSDHTSGLVGLAILDRAVPVDLVGPVDRGLQDLTDRVALVGLAARLELPVYCNQLTREAIETQLHIQIDARVFATGSSFSIGDVTVDTFPVPHDASDPVGFLVHTAAGNIGFLTDLGHATKLVVERLRCANVVLLEANHDLKMLQNDPRRPWSLKQRILSRHGHLSNDGAADVAEQILSPGLRQLYLGHLSRDCNDPELARQVVARRLERAGGGHVSIFLTCQDAPCPTFSF